SEVELRAVPRAGDRVAFALALVERAAEMGARRGDRADLVRLLRAREDNGLALELDADELPAVELLLVADRCVAVARALERRAVDADAEPEREMASEMGRECRAGVGDAREHPAEAAMSAAPSCERADIEQQARRVDERVD